MTEFDAALKTEIQKLEERFSGLSATDAAFLTYRNAMRVAPAWFEERTSFEQTDLSNVWRLYESAVLFPYVVMNNHYIEGVQLTSPNYFEYPHASDAAALLSNALYLRNRGQKQTNGQLDLDLVNSALGVTRVGIRPDEKSIRHFHEELVWANRNDLSAIGSNFSWYNEPLWRHGRPLPHQEPVLDRLRERGGSWPMIAEWYEDLVTGKFPDFDLVGELLRVGKDAYDHDEAIARAFERAADKRSNIPTTSAEAIKSEALLHLNELTKLRLQQPNDGGIGHNNPPSAIEVIVESVEKDLSRTVIALSDRKPNRWELRNISASLRRGVQSLLKLVGIGAVKIAFGTAENLLTDYIVANKDNLIQIADGIITMLRSM